LIKTLAKERKKVLFHPLHWVFWGISSVSAMIITNHPLYIGFLLLLFLALYFRHSSENFSPKKFGWMFFSWLGMVFFVSVFSVLFIHKGTHVIFTLPHFWPLSGGFITFEGLIFGGILAIQIISWILFSLFCAKIFSLSQIRLLLPPFFYEVNMVLLMALRWLPHSLQMIQKIRETQVVRGHEFRSLKTMLPLLSGSLMNGFEKSIQMAESLESRGWGREGKGKKEIWKEWRIRICESGRKMDHKIFAGTVLSLLGIGYEKIFNEKNLFFDPFQVPLSLPSLSPFMVGSLLLLALPWVWRKMGYNHELD
jgi:energy-coupling factor transporter transmembrane protein EcfT